MEGFQASKCLKALHFYYEARNQTRTGDLLMRNCAFWDATIYPLKERLMHSGMLCMFLCKFLFDRGALLPYSFIISSDV